MNNSGMPACCKSARRMRRRSRLSCYGVTACLMAAGLVSSVAADGSTINPVTTRLDELSIEQLVNLQITSVSKKETRLSASPAAVAVLTADDIRRLGATSIPEALRAIPGVQVARVSANTWAVSARGFNDEYSNKLLVLVDGRSIYTPTFGGVYWNAQDVVLEDLERIEVIRGPGATLWGANAVNGVINIITKSAKETQGGLVTTIYGTEDQPTVSGRYGGQLSSNLYYRVYVKYFNREGFSGGEGCDRADDWNMARGGFRMDWEADDRNSCTLSGDYYDGTFDEQIGKNSIYPPSYPVFSGEGANVGGDVLGRWTHQFSEDSELKLQLYYDHYERQHPYGGGVLVAAPNEFDPARNLMGERRDTWDLDAQHRFALGTREDIVWGTGYRYTRDALTSGGAEIFWDPQSDDDNIFNAFAQDDIALIPDRLRLTLGSKLEHNDYTGWEVQPAAKLLWTPEAHQTYWASVARAVRMPTRLERNARVNITAFTAPDSTPGLASAFGNPEADSETLLAYEVGCRFEPVRKLSLDLAGFYNDYDLLATSTPTTGFEATPAPPHLLQSYTYVNGLHGGTYGAELLVQWQATDRWRLTGSYGWLGNTFPEDSIFHRSSPEHQASLRSSLELGRGWQFNSAAYFVDQVQAYPQGVTQVTIPSYVRLDLGLSWQPSKNLEISCWGQNLLDSQHPEFASYKNPDLIEIPRTFYGKITWHF